VPCPFERLTRWEIETRGQVAEQVLDALAGGMTVAETWRAIARRWRIAAQPLTPETRAAKHTDRARTHPAWEEFMGADVCDLPEYRSRRTPEEIVARRLDWCRTMLRAMTRSEAWPNDDARRKLHRELEDARELLWLQTRPETGPTDLPF
jgi:hypothetical protein